MNLESSQEDEDDATASEDDALAALTNILSGRGRSSMPDSPDLAFPAMLTESEREQMLADVQKTIQQMSEGGGETFLRDAQRAAMQDWGRLLS